MPSFSATSRLLRDLIALPSVNPAFAPADAAGTGERDVAGFLGCVAAQAGLDLEFQEVLPGRPNLLIRLTPSGRVKHRLLLAPHLDTVAAAPGQLVPRRRGDRLYGRGACDTKGSVAAMFTALAALTTQARRPASTEIVLAALMDEEYAQTGSRALMASGLRADLALVGEPTCLRVITAHKGDLWLHLETRGRAAHGSRPELGRNAVHHMARIADLLETTYAAALRGRVHPVLGPPSISVGAIHGGTQPNVVPDRCTLEADRRTLPGETEASVRRELTALFRQHGLKAVLRDTKAAPCWPMDTDLRRPWVREFMGVAGQRTPEGASYFCDASVLAHGGIPSLVFGPGDIAQAHTADEWVSVRSLDRATALLTRFLATRP